MNLQDIKSISSGVARLSEEEHEALYRFTLLWSLFEAQKLKRDASVREIKKKVEQLNIEENWFQEQLDYFRDRYTSDDGATNDRFSGLRLSTKDADQVRSVLVGSEPDPKEQLISCLTIVYRFRNNFFHGEKWAYELQGQLDNFTNSSNLLKKCLVELSSDT